MKFKCLAVLGVLLLAAPASAATVTETIKYNKNGVISETNTLGQIFTLIAGQYNFGLAAEINGNSAGSITATLIGLTTPFSDFLELTFTRGGSASTSKPIDLLAGDYQINWSGGVANGTMVATATLANQTVAVPGPEAGAGLGALAMAGLAYAVSRRKKLVAAA